MSCGTKNRFQIRVNEQLRMAIQELAEINGPGFDASEIVRRCIRWANKGNAVSDYADGTQSLILGPYDYLVQARNTESPLCGIEEFRKILAHRCIDALAASRSRQQFKTQLQPGVDFLVVDT